MTDTKPNTPAAKPEPTPAAKHGGASGGFTGGGAHPAGAVTGGISPRHPSNTDGKGDTPIGIG